MSAKYEVAWQVFGTKTIEAESVDEAQTEVDEWLEDEHGMTSSVADGWDYDVRPLA